MSSDSKHDGWEPTEDDWELTELAQKEFSNPDYFQNNVTPNHLSMDEFLGNGNSSKVREKKERSRQLRFEEALMIATSLTPTERLVGLYIARHYNDAWGYAFPSHARIAQHLGFSPKTSQRSAKKLIKLGWFFCERGGGKWNGSQGTTNQYYPNWECALKQSNLISIRTDKI